jgi:hypothetical protein
LTKNICSFHARAPKKERLRFAGLPMSSLRDLMQGEDVGSVIWFVHAYMQRVDSSHTGRVEDNVTMMQDIPRAFLPCLCTTSNELVWECILDSRISLHHHALPSADTGQAGTATTPTSLSMRISSFLEAKDKSHASLECSSPTVRQRTDQLWRGTVLRLDGTGGPVCPVRFFSFLLELRGSSYQRSVGPDKD